MKQSSKCAIGGITAALSLVIMISVAIVPFFTYALPAMTGLLIMLIVIEIDNKWALGVYFAVSILSFFLVPDKEVAVMYFSFFGYYPIVKEIFEKKMSKLLSWFSKIFTFLITITGSYYVLIKAVGLQIDEIDKYGIAAIPMLLGMGLFAFIIYDIMMSRLKVLYEYKWKKYFHRYFK